jgi:DNA polymerase I-like protein with 3'-5' exonuclease and polymerase domains
MLLFHTFNEEDEDKKKLEAIIAKVFGIRKTDYDDVVATVLPHEKRELGFKNVNQKALFHHVQIPIAALYSGEDVFYMKQLYPDLIEEVKKDEQYDLYEKMRKPFMRVLWKMERRGIRLDKKRCEEMNKLAGEELDKLKYQLFDLVGTEFNVNSDQQVYEILFGHKKKMLDEKAMRALAESEGLEVGRGKTKLLESGVKKIYKESFDQNLIKRAYYFPVIEWTEGGKGKDRNLRAPKVGSDQLEAILKFDWTKPKAILRKAGFNLKKMSEKERKQIVKRWEEGKEVIQLILRYSRLEKLKSTYMEGMLKLVYKDGKIHTSYNICGTDSWRLSSSEPNLQNLVRPLEKPKEPKRENYETEEAYEHEYDRYKKEKDEYDFWIRFEIRSLFIPDEGYYLVAAD